MRRGGAPGVTRPPFIVVALLLLGLTLSAAVAVRMAATLSEGDASWVMPKPGAARPAVEAGSASAPDADPVRDILERPLFHPGRRLPSALGGLRGAPPLAEPAGRLVGVVIGGEGREALFAGADNRVTIVRQGGTLHGWIVETIEPDRVILVSAQGQRTMNLVTDRLRPATPVPAGATVAVPAGQTLWRPTPAPTPLDPATAGQPSASSGRRVGEGR